MSRLRSEGMSVLRCACGLFRLMMHSTDAEPDLHATNTTKKMAKMTRSAKTLMMSLRGAQERSGTA
jgi:hypothetical protein